MICYNANLQRLKVNRGILTEGGTIITVHLLLLTSLSYEQVILKEFNRTEPSPFSRGFTGLVKDLAYSAKRFLTAKSCPSSLDLMSMS